MTTCSIVRCYGGPDGTTPAAIKTGWRVTCACRPVETFCAACWEPRRWSIGMVSKCEWHHADAVLLEVIDLTKADPGPGYADMLRGL